MHPNALCVHLEFKAFIAKPNELSPNPRTLIFDNHLFGAIRNLIKFKTKKHFQLLMQRKLRGFKKNSFCEWILNIFVYCMYIIVS